MTAGTYVTKWPADFNPDDPSVCIVAAVVDERLQCPGGEAAPLHTHPSGQLVLATEGLVGLELESGYWSVPAMCAVWVPPGVPHTGVLGLTGKSVFFHIGPRWLGGFPDQVVRLMLNPLATELVLAAARKHERQRSEAYRDCFARMAIEELRCAKRLPSHFAPLPKLPALQKIAVEFDNPEKREWQLPEWAAFAHMSEKTLNRQVQAHTGLTFGKWRLQHLLLVAMSGLVRGESIESLAYGAGYRNTSAFIAAFKTVFGVTPGEYRKTLQNQA